jgi:hypothetical protein
MQQECILYDKKGKYVTVETRRKVEKYMTIKKVIKARDITSPPPQQKPQRYSKYQ